MTDNKKKISYFPLVRQANQNLRANSFSDTKNRVRKHGWNAAGNVHTMEVDVRTYYFFLHGTRYTTLQAPESGRTHFTLECSDCSINYQTCVWSHYSNQ